MQTAGNKRTVGGNYEWVRGGQRRENFTEKW